MDPGPAGSNNKQRTPDQKVPTQAATNQDVMDKLIQLMNRDLEENGIEND